jgi:hypothetical protein
VLHRPKSSLSPTEQDFVLPASASAPCPWEQISRSTPGPIGQLLRFTLWTSTVYPREIVFGPY